MGVFVNGILTSFAKNYCYGTSGETGLGLIRFLDGLLDWMRAEEASDKKLRREQEAVLQLQARDRADEKEKSRKRDEATETLLLARLVSEELRRAYIALSDDVTDAIRAVQIASEEAAHEQAAALEALDEVRRNAITLADGRRVYFAADGATLHDESGREIKDAASIDEARLIHQAKPQATTHESHMEALNAYDRANERAARLAATLDRLDDLKTRIHSGNATERDIDTARKELTQIVEDLPKDARGDYERLQDARCNDGAPAYRDAPTGYDARLDFAKASQPLPKINADEKQTATPAYKASPEF